MILQREVMQQNREVKLVTVPDGFAKDRVAQRYIAFFEWLDWTQVLERDETQVYPGRLPHSEASYIKAYLVMVCEKHSTVSTLHQYLLEHPALVWVIGFRVVADEQRIEGFDVEASIPTAGHLRRKLQTLNDRVLTALLAGTVETLCEIIPDLGETVSLDVKHIYAYVKANNPRTYVKDRYDKTQQPSGDPDCRLGVKRNRNQETTSGQTKVEKEYLWGYGTGIAVTRTPEGDEVVLAEYTQPFNAADVTYGLSLLERSRRNLKRPPRNITADAAFDAWYMYQGSAEVGGIAAIALNLRGHPTTCFGENGYPICACNGLEMTPGCIWIEDTHRCQSFTCFHCRNHRILNIEPGGLMRLQLDRQSDAYKNIYKQRTAAERINSQAKEHGIERPRQRNQQSVAHRNTLIYIVINVKTLHRIHKRKRNSKLSRRVA